MRLRSAYDREIFRLAVPALGALAVAIVFAIVFKPETRDERPAAA